MLSGVAVTDNNYDTAYVSSVMGTLRRAQGRDAEAAEQFRTNLALLIKIYGESHFEVAQTRVSLAGCLVAQQSEETRKEAAALLETDIANTMNMPAESLELNYPIRVISYRLWEDSAGAGRQRGPGRR